MGDVFFTQKCMRFLRAFIKTGTLIFVSHDTAAVTALCRRAIWLEKGQVLQEGSPKEVCERYLEAFYEAQQGKGTTTRLKANESPEATRFTRDQRLEFINASNLRNDLRLFAFDLDAAGFGEGGATITHVEFRDGQGNPLGWVVGGEEVRLQVSAACHQVMESPIIGFYIKDRLGQPLFGDNTYLSYMEAPLPCAPGQSLRATFVFEMPRLAAGDYTVAVAIADGVEREHVQHHWIHDALHFKSESSSVSAGVIGIPMKNVVLEREK